MEANLALPAGLESVGNSIVFIKNKIDKPRPEGVDGDVKTGLRSNPLNGFSQRQKRIPFDKQRDLLLFIGRLNGPATHKFLPRPEVILIAGRATHYISTLAGDFHLLKLL